MLTATGGALVGPAKQEAVAARHEAAAAAQRDLVAQRVAQVWRSAGSAGQAAPGPEQPSESSSDVVALQAELVSERGGSASRSQDRLTAAQPQAPAGTDTTAGAAGAPADPSDPVGQAAARVQELVVQQDADDADADHAARATTASAEQARQAVAAAEQQRADEAAAAELAAAQADPRSVAAPLAADHGWGAEQFACLDRLWTKESGWKWWADNPTSSAYGIPQSLPGTKMASHGADWETDPRVQIAWGLDYIAASYGTPCRAWAHSQAVNWY